MISEAQFQNELNLIISNAIREDVGNGDHSSLACIPKFATGKAKLIVKDNGVIAGVAFAKKVFDYVDSDLKIKTFINDGENVIIAEREVQALQPRTDRFQDGTNRLRPVLRCLHKPCPCLSCVRALDEILGHESLRAAQNCNAADSMSHTSGMQCCPALRSAKPPNGRLTVAYRTCIALFHGYEPQCAVNGQLRQWCIRRQ